MSPSTREHYDAHPDPSPERVPIGPAQLDRLDDALHYAWAWHRYKFVFRKAERLRILDAGCGTGLGTLMLAALNPGSAVVGVDASPRSLEIAGERAAASGLEGVEFREHDLTGPLPASWGEFDFVVARGVLGGDDDAAILAALARALDDRGLLLATFPKAGARDPAARLRLAVAALVPPDATAAERAGAGLDLLLALRPDHPIRKFVASRLGPDLPGPDAFAEAYLAGDEPGGWTIATARLAVERAGLKFLYVASRAPWRPDRVFGPEISPGLRDRVAALDELGLAALKDALDGAIYPDAYAVHACPAGFEPHLPAWPDDPDPAAISRLVPHATGLSAPAEAPARPAPTPGRVVYRTASGALGELDPRSDRAMRLVDGRRTIAAIEDQLAAESGPDSAEARKARWSDLANFGFVLLESPDPRQHVDCIHLGPVLDRLDCACPRRWVRGCERYAYCTVSTVPPDDPKAPALREALGRLGSGPAMACDRCPDYAPED